MKDQRFIELLNLYIDRQISAAETTELEAEIQQSPARQAVYRQYCKIHSASKLVYASFRANASEQPVLPTDRTGVVELFETKRRKGRFAYAYYASGLAAAACLTLVFMRYNDSVAPATGEVVAVTKTEVRPTLVATSAVEAPAAAPLATAEPVVGLVSLRNNATTTPDYSAMLADLREQDEARAMAIHLQAARAPSLFDDGLFNANRSMPVGQEPRLFRIQQTSGQQAESTAFQFQR